MYVNTFTAYEKYSPHYRDNLRNKFTCNYVRNGKRFLEFMLHFWDLDLNFNIFKKKLTLTANAFKKLRTRKEGLTKVSRKCGLTVPVNKQHGKGAKTPSNYHGRTFIKLIEHR